MKKTRYHILLTIAVAVSALVIGYPFLPTHAVRKAAGPPVKVTIAYSATTDSVPAARDLMGLRKSIHTGKSLHAG